MHVSEQPRRIMVSRQFRSMQNRWADTRMRYLQKNLTHVLRGDDDPVEDDNDDASSVDRSDEHEDGRPHDETVDDAASSSVVLPREGYQLPSASVRDP